MLNVYLFQVNYQAGLGKYISQWLPYSIATVWASAESNLEINQNFEVREVIFKREPIDSVAERLDNPDLCMFSNYIWNENYNQLMAAEIKKKYPDCTIVFGGPQVNEDGYSFLENNQFVDAVVVNEGETSTQTMLLDLLHKRPLEKVYNKPPRVNLSNKPSPYLDSKLLEKVIQDNPGTKWATTLETNRGCPFKCSFCDWGSLTQSKITKFDLDRVLLEIDWIAVHGIDYIYIADANFGVFYDRDKEVIERLIENKNKVGNPQSVNITWYKNSSEQVLELAMMLHNAKLNRGLTLSVQSMNLATLENIQRTNMETSNLGKMYSKCNDHNIEFYTEFILGLPYETKKSWRKGICDAVELGCHSALEIFPTEILRNSDLAKQINEHKMEIFQFETIEPRQLTEIPERHNFVVSTKYMSRDDLLDSWMWGWLIINFHAYGWTQIITRFANKHLGISMLDLYEDFFENCIKTDDFLWNLYKTQRKELETFFFHDANAANIMQNDDVVVYRHQMEWQYNRKHVQQKINLWALKLLGNQVNSTILENLLTVSNSYTVNYENINDIDLNLKYNIPDYVLKTDIKLHNIGYKYIAKNLTEWDNLEDFKAKLALRHRYGFSKRIIKRIEA
jgi:radical SAM superfamily enzyme YgiQ (UPF0313 family)